MVSEDQPDWVNEQKIFTNLTERYINKAIAFGEKWWRQKLAQARLKHGASLARYLVETSEDCQRVRNILYESESVPLDEIYVPIQLGRNQNPRRIRHSDLHGIAGQQISDDDFIAHLQSRGGSQGRFKNEKAFIINGIAGTGKSILMKRIFLQTVSMEQGILPVFIELRSANSHGRLELDKLIFLSLRDFSPDFMFEECQILLQGGQILLLLDGFDEINTSLSGHYADEIRRFARQYEQCCVVVSGRPTDEFKSWVDFEIFDVLPFDGDQSVALIRKLRFDPAIIDAFVNELRNRLLFSHHEFASNPLLLCVMFLTFQNVAEVSPGKHQFELRR